MKRERSKRIDRHVGRLLVLRARLFLRMLAVVIPILALGDGLLRSSDWPALLAIKGTVEALLLLSLHALRRSPRRSRAVALCLGAIAACAAGTVGSGLVANDPAAALLTLGALGLLAAVTLPWGLPGQAGATAITALAAGVSVLLAQTPVGYPQLAAGFAFAVGLVVSYGVDKQRRRTLEATRRRATSAATLRAVLHNAPDAILIIDERGRIEFSNRRFSPRTRIDPVGRLLFDFLAKEDHALVRNRLSIALAGGEAVPFETTTRFAEGGRSYRCRLAPLRRPDEPPAAILVASDITAERRAELERQESREVAAALTGVGRRLLAALSGTDLTEEICAAAAAVVPCTRCRILPTDGPWQGTLPAAPIAALLTGDAVELSEVELRSIAPGAAPSEAVPEQERALAVLLRVGGDVLGLLALHRRDAAPFGSRDRRVLLGIAQLAALALRTAALVRELREANHVNSYFAATMSHEIRNQLASVVGYAQLMLEERGPEDPLSKEGVFFLERIRDRGQEALGVIASALEASRSENASRAAWAREEIDPGELFAELVEEVEGLRQGAAPHVRWDVEAGLGPLRSDRVKLRMILKNLVSNALKFTREGEICLSARRDGERILLSVTDTGVGIPAQQLPNVFRPFAQAHGRLSRDSGGTGLGLFIVQRLVEVIGGTIGVESIAGSGTTFTIALPAHEAYAEEAPPAEAPSARPA